MRCQGDEQGRQQGQGAVGCSYQQSSGKPNPRQAMSPLAAFLNTTATPAGLWTAQSGCVHPTPQQHSWERGPREQPRAKAKPLGKKSEAGPVEAAGCGQRGQTATSHPSCLPVSFTDLLALSHCPSNDSTAELPLRGVRHELHPNGILVTAGVAPGSQVCPVLLPPPTLAKLMGHLCSQAWA